MTSIEIDGASRAMTDSLVIHKGEASSGWSLAGTGDEIFPAFTRFTYSERPLGSLSRLTPLMSSSS